MCLTGPHFKCNGYYVQYLHICVGACQIRRVNLSWTCITDIAVSLLRFSLGADPLISQLLWVLADTPGRLPGSLWPMTYWWQWEKKDWDLTLRWGTIEWYHFHCRIPRFHPHSHLCLVFPLPSLIFLLATGVSLDHFFSMILHQNTFLRLWL